MSLIVNDKRKVTRDRTAENRQRFLRRIKDTIKEQLPDLISGRGLGDMDQTGAKIRVKRKTIREPFFHHGEGGNLDRVLPGNKDYVPGDLLDKPPRGGGGSGRQAGDGDDSTDDFIVDLTREEFLANYFEDLELPELLETEFSKLKEIVRENAGFQTDGSPTKLSLVRSFKNSYGRRLAIFSGIDEELEELEKELVQFMRQNENTGLLTDIIDEINKKILELKERRECVPMFEEVDLRFKTSTTKTISKSHATMIMIMDNSGSMGEKEKTIARKFFWLLYKFLKTNYDEIDLRFVSHTTSAHEMGEEEFFNTQETGGTLVSSALDEVVEMLNGNGKDYTGAQRKKLVGMTNIYIAQVSDGDNMDYDNGTCTEILEDDILPFSRYFAYIQVDEYHDALSANPTLTSLLNNEKGLWKSYNNVSLKNKKLQARRVFDARDIYPVFSNLFSKDKT